MNLRCAIFMMSFVLVWKQSNGQHLNVGTDKKKYCIGDSITFINQSTDFIDNIWRINDSASSKDVCNIQFKGDYGVLNSNTYANLIEDNDTVFAFCNSYSTGDIVKLTYSSGIRSKPDVKNVGSGNGILGQKSEGLYAVIEGNNRYLFTVAYNRLVRLEFGNSYSNKPKFIDMGNFSELQWPHEIQMMKFDGFWYGIVACRSLSNAIVVYKWTNGLEKLPDFVKHHIGGTDGASGVVLVRDKNNGEFYAYFSTINGDGLQRLGFGTDLMNASAKFKDFNYQEGMQIARGIKIIQNCGGYIGYFTGENGVLLQVNFPDGLGGELKTEQITNYGDPLEKMEGISNFIYQKDGYYALISSPNKGVYLMHIGDDKIGSNVFSKEKVPQPMIATESGKYSVKYTLDPLRPTQHDTCFEFEVMDCRKFDSFGDTIYCENDLPIIRMLGIKGSSANNGNLYYWYYKGDLIQVGLDSIFFALKPGEYVGICEHDSTSETFNFIIATKNCNCEWFVSNVFTPGIDGFNDVFDVRATCNIYYRELKIFNRWGELLYYSDNPSFGWTGKSGQMLCPDGVYYYQMKVSLGENEETKEVHGPVHLIRE
ncbi:MAG: gliding motility-associated C-terminal domain-containing protein [Bacteroidetes bacterium]|nr:gliding motility-associated C-terminal domain-containing protein [Bacteroidota bacterium]